MLIQKFKPQFIIPLNKANYVRGGGKTLQNITNTETRHTKNLVDCLYYQVPIQIRFFFIIGNKTPERAKCRIV